MISIKEIIRVDKGSGKIITESRLKKNKEMSLEIIKDSESTGSWTNMI